MNYDLILSRVKADFEASYGDKLTVSDSEVIQLYGTLLLDLQRANLELTAKRVKVDSVVSECLAAKDTCDVFLRAVGVDSPIYEFKVDALHPTRYGCYTHPPPQVTVWALNCRVGGWQRAAHGFWQNTTILGVTAHEVAHHVAKHVKKRLYGGFWDPFNKEPGVCDNSKLSMHEDWADAVMLLVTNPDLLRTLCPMRHAYLTQECGMPVLEGRRWDEVLTSEEHRQLVRDRIDKLVLT